MAIKHFGMPSLRISEHNHHWKVFGQKSREVSHIFIWQIAICIDSMIPAVVAEKLPDLEEIAFDVKFHSGMFQLSAPKSLSNCFVVGGAVQSLHIQASTHSLLCLHCYPMAVQTSESTIPKREAVMVAFKDVPRRYGNQKRLILKYEPESKVYTYVTHP